jgi:hypothetical protein
LLNVTPMLWQCTSISLAISSPFADSALVEQNNRMFSWIKLFVTHTLELP